MKIDTHRLRVLSDGDISGMIVLKTNLRTLKSTVAITALGLVLSGCAIQPTTYGTGESAELGLIRDVTSLATFGTLGKEKKARIAYRERAPLVVPPSVDQGAIPSPISKVDQVDDNFPGRGEEILREERAERRKKIEASPNSIIGSPAAQPLINTEREKKFEDDRKARKLLADRGKQNDAFSQVGNSAVDSREVLKTREDLAKELGVPVESIPKTLDDKSLLERAGIVRRKTGRAGERLTDVPVEYRTVEAGPDTGDTKSDVNTLLEGKKKKKRFIFF